MVHMLLRDLPNFLRLRMYPTTARPRDNPPPAPQTRSQPPPASKNAQAHSSDGDRKTPMPTPSGPPCPQNHAPVP